VKHKSNKPNKRNPGLKTKSKDMTWQAQNYTQHNHTINNERAQDSKHRKAK